MSLLRKIKDNVKTIIQDESKGNLEKLEKLETVKRFLEGIVVEIDGWKYANAEEIAEQYKANPEKLKGYSVEFRNGRKTYDFKNVPEVENLKKELKEVENRYKSLLTAKINGSTLANVTEDGEILPLPEINYGKSYLAIKTKK